MKGIVFTEFLTMAEERFSLAVVDRIIDRADLQSQGAYTSVGTYPAEEMIRLLIELSRESGIGIPDLLRTFGRYLLGRFTVGYQQFFTDCPTCFDLLSSIESHIHVEVLKLYPDASLPTFTCERPDPATLIMVYRSRNGLADLAEGLIEGCAAHYGEDIAIESEDLSAGQKSCVRFTLRKRSPSP